MKVLLLLAILAALLSCSPNSFQSEIGSSTNYTSSGDDDIPPDPVFKFQALEWEATRSGSSAWSNHIYDVIRNEEPQMLGQNVADDIEKFCPKYRTLNDNQRLNFWGQLFAGMAKFESSWNPATRMIETTMGIDPVTGQQVASEGLLQLSYQDERSYGFNCGFDWNRDRLLGVNDPRKTIFDPKLNLRCGIKIMARQLKNKRAISLSSGVYWAVLKIDGRYTKISEISAITKKITACVR